MPRKTAVSRPGGPDSRKQKGTSAAKAVSRRAAGGEGRTPAAVAKQAAPHSGAAGVEAPPADILNRAEADMAAAIESLNRQMTAAMSAITELAVSQRGRGAAVVRTAPLDRATATFHRLVADVLDEKLAELLPPVVALRSELEQRMRDAEARGAEDGEFYRRAVDALDHVLAVADVHPYDARTGEAFDPLIHLAVGETSRHDLGDGVVADVLQRGFRSARGKVIAPVRVKVNRR